MGKKKRVQPAESVKSPELGFEDAMQELEAIVKRLEAGGGSLDEALEDYGSAIRLMKQCHHKLSKVERQIELLSGVDAEGNPISRPLDEATEDESLEDKRAKRGVKRSAKPEDSDNPGLF